MVGRILHAGGAIRNLRKKAGWSLAQMAERLGWDKGRLSRYENNRVGISRKVVEEIARALGKPPEVVMLYCLQHTYPQLSLDGSDIGRLLRELVSEIGCLDQEKSD
jgi:transcriptional regulator with XRE-family HTH domain